MESRLGRKERKTEGAAQPAKMTGITFWSERGKEGRKHSSGTTEDTPRENEDSERQALPALLRSHFWRVGVSH